MQDNITFGFQASPASGVPATDRELYDGVLTECAFAHGLGFEVAWMLEHHFSDYFPCPSPMLFLSHVARALPDLGLGTAVLVLPWYHPVRLAAEISMLSNLTHAPLHIGLGRGTAKFEYDSFSIDMAQARRRFAESVKIMKRALSGERFSYEGEFFSVPKPVPLRPTPNPAQVTLYGAIGSPGSASIMADLGLPPIAIANFPDRLLVQIMQNWRDRTRELGHAEGNSFPLLVRLMMAETDAEAHERARRYYPSFFQLQCDHYGTDDNPWSGVEEYKDFSRMFANLKKMTDPDNLGPFLSFNLVGSAETVRARLRQLADMGWNNFCLTCALPGTPVEVRRESMTRFARDVAPQFSTRFRRLHGETAGAPAAALA